MSAAIGIIIITIIIISIIYKMVVIPYSIMS